MAWVLLTGEDVAFYQNALLRVRPVGHAIVAAADGTVALQLLGDVARARRMVVLLWSQMGQMDVTEFFAAVAVDAELSWRHAYILLHETPGRIPAEVERYLDLLAVPAVGPPASASDEDGWADLLDEIETAARRLAANAGPGTR